VRWLTRVRATPHISGASSDTFAGAGEGVGLHDAEIVAGEEAEAAAAGQEAAEVGPSLSRPLGMTKPTATSAVVAFVSFSPR
jgi:hypothetical protein